jgi:hypothetical protein
LLLEVDVSGLARLPVLLAIGAAGAALAGRVRRTHRRIGAEVLAPEVAHAGAQAEPDTRLAEAGAA